MFHMWCGQTIRGRVAVGRDLAPPEPEEVCGTCDGRARGAGQIPQVGDVDVAFTPRWLGVPRVCPGASLAGLYVPLNRQHSAGRCLVCGHVGRVRGGYRGGYGWSPPRMSEHAPDLDGLVPRCDLHGWQHIRRLGDTQAVVCECCFPRRGDLA